MSLKFDHLFESAIQEWPETINLSIINSQTKYLEMYSIDGLTGEREDAFIGKNDEIITRNLQGAIYAVVHYAAKATTVIERRHIRSIAVQIKFEEMLRRCVGSSDLDWTDSDRELVNKYFLANAR